MDGITTLEWRYHWSVKCGWVCIYLYISTYTNIYICVYMYVYTHTDTHTSIKCKSIFKYTCYVYVSYIYTDLYASINTDQCVYIWVYLYEYVYICINTHMCQYTYVCISYIQIWMCWWMLGHTTWFQRQRLRKRGVAGEDVTDESVVNDECNPPEYFSFSEFLLTRVKSN